MTEELLRLELGFHGGQTLVARLASSERDALVDAFTTGRPEPVVVTTSEGRVLVRPDRVTYLRWADAGQRIGYASS